MIEELGEIVRAAGGFLAEVVARILRGFMPLAPAFALGCQGPTVTPIKVEQKPGAIAQPERQALEPKALGDFTITFYYVIGEDEIAAKQAANDNRDNHLDGTELAAMTSDPDEVSLYDAGSCSPIAKVSHEFANQLAIQGTGKLHDGRVLNIWGRCKCGDSRSACFKVTANRWGTSGSNHPLQPFRTVAVDPNVVKLGTLLYVPLLEGRTMPGRAPWGGYVHDGCVVADDTGGHIDGHRLDLFVGRKAYFLGLSGSGSSHAWAKHVPIYDGSQICERKGRKVSRKSGSI
ncbi:MAG: 3D domain-containing protein [Kofleriaceae bacterium]